jgi:hypothetical protein
MNRAQKKPAALNGDGGETARWRNRIIGSGFEDAKALMANPMNYRVHSTAQQKALGAVLDTVGWVQEVIVNKASGFIIDGHMRVAMAAKNGENVPVKFVDLSPDEEKIVLATFDPLSAMATTSDLLRDTLIAELSTIGYGDLLALLAPKASTADSSKLAERFGVPPFSVLDARQGYWQDRKRAWLALGIQSELGRGGHLEGVRDRQPD